jgi:hypothetical protein
MIKYHFFGTFVLALLLSGCFVGILGLFIAHQMDRLSLPFDRCLSCVPGIDERLVPEISRDELRFVQRQ